MEQKIVKVPEYEVVVALGRPEPIAARSVDLEKDLAIHQKGEKFHAGKAVLPPQPADLLRGRERGEEAREFSGADPEQRAGARRFQHHLIAAPSQIREPRQHDGFGSAEC